MKKGWKRIVLLLMVLALSSVLCLFLNRANNKYTAPGAQALDGLLLLPADELAEHRVHYLIHGWAFYPDVLLEPEDFEAGGAAEYMMYTSIGEHTRFDWREGEASQGCGTYVLNLNLPEESAHYTLHLPEIYSAYRLYADDRLIAQAGNPEPEHYQDRTRSRVVSFRASGMTRLMLSTGNWSHFYSGMVYPIALGSEEDITRIQGGNWCIYACVILLGFVGAALSLWLGIRMKRSNARLFALLCLTAALNAGAPLLHSFAELPVQPWYALEVFLSYFAAALILILQNKLCEAHAWPARVMEFAALAFCLIALAYGLCAPRLETWHIRAFSALSALFKLGVAGWLLGVSLFSLLKRGLSVGQLFYGAVFYAAMLAWDRILPEYEPVLGGWFAQWGGLAMVFLIGYTLWRDVLEAYSYSVTFAEEHRQVRRQLAMQLEHAQQISDCFQANQRLVHDFRHHMRTIQGMAAQIQEGQELHARRESLLAYLDALCSSDLHRGEARPSELCNLPAVDSLLQYYCHAAANSGVSAMLQLYIPAELPLTDLEWCAVLGNLLENALEGCARSDAQYPEMHISTKWTGKTFFLMIENTYDGHYSLQGNSFLSGKRGNRRLGIGLESVREKILRHGGSVDIYPMETSFRVGITLTVEDAKGTELN